MKNIIATIIALFTYAAWYITWKSAKNESLKNQEKEEAYLANRRVAAEYLIEELQRDYATRLLGMYSPTGYTYSSLMTRQTDNLNALYRLIK